MRVENLLENSVRLFPKKAAIVYGDQRMCFAELNALANRLAVGLRARGINRGDRVVLFLENRIETVVGLFAVLKAGGIFCVVNPSTKADKLAYILGNCRARAIITQQKELSTVVAAIEQASCVEMTVVVDVPGEPAVKGGVSLNDILTSCAPIPPRDPGIDIDLAMIIYTSGSTGFPKGVMMTHQNIIVAATSITTYLENSSDDVILNVLPLSFDYGLYQALMSVKVGSTLILESSFAFPAVTLKKLRDEGVTGFPVVPTMAAILLRMTDIQPGDFPALRYITNTAAALPPAHIRRLQELFPSTRIYSMYGLTECKRCTYLPPEELGKRPESVGKAIPNTEAYIVDEHGNRLGPGVVGELVIRGGHVMKGYWENPEETEKRLGPGEYPWENVLYTGDLFRMDEDGFLYFLGRKDDIIKSRGEKVSPKEVENVLYMLEGIKEAAVVGAPDPILGMAIKAVVVLAEKAELTDKQIIAHCSRNLEDFMVPKLVEFRSQLPKTDSGKIQRGRVQDGELARESGSSPTR